MIGLVEDLVGVVLALRWLLVLLGFGLVCCWLAVVVGERNEADRENRELWDEVVRLRAGRSPRRPGSRGGITRG